MKRRMGRMAAAIGALSVSMVAATASGEPQPRPAEPFRADIEKLAERSSDFRRVLYTGSHVQIVAMSLPSGQSIGAETHDVDQCFFVVDGQAEADVAGKKVPAKEDEVLCVPAGARHDIRNSGRGELKLYTVYSPPKHPPGTVHRTKADAERAEKQPAR